MEVTRVRWVGAAMIAVAVAGRPCPADEAAGRAAEVLREANVRAGLCALVGGGPPSAALAVELARAAPGLIVHVLDADAGAVAAVRGAAVKAGLAGRVTAEHWTLDRLPYPDNFANLLAVSSDACRVPREELLRALAPGGAVLLPAGAGGARQKLTKPRPPGMDEWTHHRHGPDCNPVSRDSIDMTTVPDRLRWAGDELRCWSHAIRTAGGRVFVFIRNTISARDAYNGVSLWKRSYEHVYTGSAPSAAYNRPVAVGDRVYAHGSGGGVAIIDAASGEVLRTIDRPERLIELICAESPSGPALLLRDANAVSCYDGRTGEQRWHFAAPANPKVVAPLG